MKLSDLNNIEDSCRQARTAAFRYLAISMKRREVQLGKKFSKQFRRRLCLELDCELIVRMHYKDDWKEPGVLYVDDKR